MKCYRLVIKKRTALKRKKAVRNTQMYNKQEGVRKKKKKISYERFFTCQRLYITQKRKKNTFFPFLYIQTKTKC